MGQHLLPGNPPVEITLRRSARAKRISLRVSGLDGRITLTMPHRGSEREALNFARSKQAWLQRHLADKPQITPVAYGEDIPLAGALLRITPHDGRKVMLADGMLHVPGAPEQVGTRVRAFLKAQARDRLAAASDHYAGRLGRGYSKISLRDTRSRWGSCSSQGGLMFSWRLIMAPPRVLDYVAAHEVAHLREMNHSPAFWALVEHLMPDYRQPRQWLRHNGQNLHRYHFTD